MRDIRFKAKRIDNSEWVEGDLLHKDGKTYIYGSYIDESGVYIEDMTVDPSTVCQFTGLTDMKGREIWEHDYVTDFPHCGEVIFVDGGFAMHSDVCDLPLETFVDRIKNGVFGTYGKCLVTNQGSVFGRKEGEG